ncbi:MAG: phosphoribosylamine--glycine ligase [Francisellaceae bacterium]
MNVLVIGNGGREHALAWKLAQSPLATTIYVAPGNAGTMRENKVQNVDIAVDDIDRLIVFAKETNIALTIVGPELPLSLGIVDRFNEASLACLGPTRYCAQLESSKAFSKDFMAKHKIPTAHYQNFTDIAKAKDYVVTQRFPIVIKASGLAAGKGVVIAKTLEEANHTIEDMLSGNKFGEAGAQIVIEEFLDGIEASFIVLCDGKTVLPMASSQDHKAKCDGDKGPNTGGMGAYSPAPVVTADIHKATMDKIILPVLKGLEMEGHHYKGFLYAGLMILPSGEIKTLEFNCRFGDPETQPIMMRLQSDFLELALSAVKGTLAQHRCLWSNKTALSVVMTAAGYPESYPTGEVISGLHADENDADLKIFHAATTEKEGHIVTNGGRVLTATALGNGVEEAFDRAYALVSNIHWKHEFHRTDIGKKAFNIAKTR